MVVCFHERHTEESEQSPLHHQLLECSTQHRHDSVVQVLQTKSQGCCYCCARFMSHEFPVPVKQIKLGGRRRTKLGGSDWVAGTLNWYYQS